MTTSNNNTTGLTNAMAACKRSFDAELAAKRTGRKFDGLGALAEIIGSLDPTLSATVLRVRDNNTNGVAEADRLAAARAADPELDARVAARRAARKAAR
jgi:hypothetical protein